jgi:hypothetical protein
MSIHIVVWVLEHSKARLAARLVLLSLANHAREDGSNTFPSQATIASEALISERQVRRCLKELQREGAITRTGKSAASTLTWRINMPDKLSAPDELSTGQIGSVPRTNRAESGRKCPTNRHNRQNRKEEDHLNTRDHKIVTS